MITNDQVVSLRRQLWSVLKEFEDEHSISRQEVLAILATMVHDTVANTATKASEVFAANLQAALQIEAIEASNKPQLSLASD